MLSELRNQETALAERTCMPWHVTRWFAAGHYLLHERLARHAVAILIGVLTPGSIFSFRLFRLLDELSLPLRLVGLIDWERVAVYVMARLFYEGM
jgi:hypothetical protein